jgi:hypothetical protein
MEPTGRKRRRRKMENSKRGRPVGSVDIEVQDRILNEEIEKVNRMLKDRTVNRSMVVLVGTAKILTRALKHIERAAKARQLLTENS